MALGLGVLACSPLVGGRISAPGAVTDLLVAKARDSGVSVSAAAYAWILAHPARPIPIVGSQRPERIREAAGAWRVEWSRQEWYDLLQTSMGERLP